jgi:hypothetical protein
LSAIRHSQSRSIGQSSTTVNLWISSDETQVPLIFSNTENQINVLSELAFRSTWLIQFGSHAPITVRTPVVPLTNIVCMEIHGDGSRGNILSTRETNQFALFQPRLMQTNVQANPSELRLFRPHTRKASRKTTGVSIEYHRSFSNDALYAVSDQETLLGSSGMSKT